MCSNRWRRWRCVRCVAVGWGGGCSCVGWLPLLIAPIAAATAAAKCAPTCLTSTPTHRTHLAAAVAAGGRADRGGAGRERRAGGGRGAAVWRGGVGRAGRGEGRRVLCWVPTGAEPVGWVLGGGFGGAGGGCGGRAVEKAEWRGASLVCACGQRRLAGGCGWQSQLPETSPTIPNTTTH